MFAPWTRQNFNPFTILVSALKSSFLCIFGPDTVSGALEYLRSGLNIPVFFESWKAVTREIMEYSHDGSGIKDSKHLFVIRPLTPHPRVSSSFMSLYTPYFPTSPPQDACTDGPTAAGSPSGSRWHGRLFGPLPLPSSPVCTGAQKCVGAGTEWRGTEAEPIWPPSRMVTARQCWQQRERKIPHICHRTRFTTEPNQCTIVG